MNKTTWGFDNVTLEDMIGRTFTSVTANRDELTFTDAKGTFTFSHDQECCESVEIEDIVGDLNDLVGSPLLTAYESCSQKNPEGVTKEYQDSFTWTFYKFATIKGYVDVRWYGESNGYYSEGVYLDYTGEAS
jgi:hypothetical protein